MESGHRGRNTGSPDVSVNHGVGSLIGYACPASNTSESRSYTEGWSIGAVEAPVVKVQGFGLVPAASALPAKSLAAVVIVAVYCVVAVRLAVGAKVAI